MKHSIWGCAGLAIDLSCIVAITYDESCTNVRIATTVQALVICIDFSKNRDKLTTLIGAWMDYRGLGLS